MTTVAIHTHPGSLPFGAYLLSRLADHWRPAGIRVEVVAGVRPVPGARLGILHVDLTRVPAEYAPLRGAYPVLLNGDALDVGKRRLGELRVSRDDPYDGPVIVKTDLNTRGIPERIALRAAQHAPGRLWGSVLDHLFPRRPTGRMWHRRGYPVFRDAREVPGWVWRRPELVVERFVPEPTPSGGYATRHWRFLGEREWNTMRHSRDPRFADGSGVTGPGSPPPPEVRAIRAAAGLVFGKIDYVVHEGRARVLDLNKTPGDTLAAALPEAAAPWLAQGIQQWL